MPKIPQAEDDIAVRREEICKLFNPAPGKTAFHDWVNKGRIVKARGLTGYFLLNATRLRIRMPPVDVKAYRKDCSAEQQAQKELQLGYLAVLELDDRMFHVMPDIPFPDELTNADVQKVLHILDVHRPVYAEVEGDLEKAAYCKGILDALG
ncbi:MULTISPECIES: hypothetical protein [unclassified Lentimonas]|uniref:hypothetical protein n=1 Tax=unclassified Lentimonas TaxID=2630993 RepID=UPI0013222DCD|nr:MULTISPECIES: hypothetical protein [unclassified Lentimonas]CAA6692605.1 Unannotated [Lentimonas sp. CC19]CAA6696957.1 Unannotated [Lentimonas sp. CC10]CAA7070989.1 Unannotated [Lentimonas sp. CC11]